MGPEKAAIFDAHIQIANDPAMLDEIKTMINTQNVSAIFATNEITQNYINMFASLEDAYMKERAADIKDVANRIIHKLAGHDLLDLTSIHEEVIIVANDLTPSQTAQLDKKFVKGL